MLDTHWFWVNSMSSPVEEDRLHQCPADSGSDDAGGIFSSLENSVTARPTVSSAQSFTPRSLLVGLLIGALITFSNTYFGLQTGWISTMAMPSALIGFSIFKVLSKHLSFPFTPIENVLIQTVAGAVGSMPLGCGFVGVIPALEFLLDDGKDGPPENGPEGGEAGGGLQLNFWKLCVWSLGVCLFGVVFAVPLRKETIIREKLKFPSGTASALMLRVLHGKGEIVNGKGGDDTHIQHPGRTDHGDTAAEEEPSASVESTGRGPLLPKEDDVERQQVDRVRDWKSKMRLLVGAFCVSGIYVRKKFLPIDIHNLFFTNGCCRRFFPTLCLRFVTCLS